MKPRTKKQLKHISKKRKTRRGHLNPIFPKGSTVKFDFIPPCLLDPGMEAIESMGADIILRESVRGCTASEKLLIATMIPPFLKLIRKTAFEPLLDGRDTPHEAAKPTEAK